MNTRPPIIYLNCHDAGRLIQPHGHAIATPHLQRFAEENIFFRQAHNVAPTCSASRAGLLTGSYPHQVGMLGLAHRGFALDNYDRHLVHQLKQAGYLTALSGVQHVAGFETYMKQIGYDADLTPPREELRGRGMGERDRLYARAAARFVEKHADQAQPFYLECGFFYPHRPYPDLPIDEDVRFAAPPFYLPDSPATRRDLQAYQRAVASADDCFGIVFDALRRTGVWDRAVIIVTTDHGPAFPGAKCQLNDQGTGVMLMLRLPDHRQPGAVDALVTHLDIRPTLDTILGLQPDHPREGRSLLPLLAGKVSGLHDEIFAEVSYHAAYEPMRSVRTARYRYVRRYDNGWGHTVLPNIDDSPCKDELLAVGLRDQLVEPEALYDVALDPAERRNLVTDAGHAAIRQALAGRLDVWMRRTIDPLLAGAVPLPVGAIATPANATSVT